MERPGEEVKDICMSESGDGSLEPSELSARELQAIHSALLWW